MNGTVITFRVSRKEVEALERQAAKEGRSVSDIVRRAIQGKMRRDAE